MARRIGPSVWGRIWNNFSRLVTKQTEKIYVGNDNFGNKFYEYKGGRSDRTNINR